MNAVYTKSNIPAWIGNPLIEALGQVRERSEVRVRMSTTIEYWEQLHELRKADAADRIEMLGDLSQIYAPLTPQVDLGRKIRSAIRNGYVSRRPNTPEFRTRLQEEYEEQLEGDWDKPAPDRNRVLACEAFIGISGMGKSRTLERALSTEFQVYWHGKYRFVQVTYLKVDMPSDGSRVSLLKAIHQELDRVLGENQAPSLEHAGVKAMEAKFIARAKLVNLGILVIDELQHVFKTTSINKNENALDFLVGLTNASIAPVMMVGTLKCFKYLSTNLRIGRRSIGEILLNLKYGDEWDKWIAAIWKFQLTKKFCPLTDELNEAMYLRTQGIPSLARVLYQLAQRRAIDNGFEEITLPIIHKTADEHFAIVQPFLNLLAKTDVEDLLTNKFFLENEEKLDSEILDLERIFEL